MIEKDAKSNKKMNIAKDSDFLNLAGRAAKPYNNYRETRHFSKRNALLVGSVLILAFIACAHKAPPLSKDRLAPKLQRVSALNNRQTQFTFSEQLDTLNLKPEYFSIITGTDTLKIMLLYASLSASEIIAITELQYDTVYQVSGYVFDTAQNKGAFEEFFSGTSKPDTIVPWIVDYSQGAKQKEFTLTFSEAMDTAFLNYYILPKKNLKPTWLNIRTCHLKPETPADSLCYDTTYYLYTEKGFRDISNNAINSFVTSITPDTIYRPIRLEGKVQLQDTLVKSGLAVLKKIYPLGIAIVEQGSFSFEVRDSTVYAVEVISGRYSGSAMISVDSTNIIFLRLEEKNIDSLIN